MTLILSNRMPIIIATLCCAWSTCRGAAMDDLNDLAARLQFDFYAADARALQQDLQLVANLKLDDTLSRARDYQLAYGQWKLAEISRNKDRSAARRAADACVEATDRAIEAVPKRATIPRPDVMHAELQAMQSACLGMLGELGGTTMSRSNKSLEAARILQPSNPRVLLVGATSAISKAKTATERAAAERAIAAAIAAFDKQSPGSSGAADWGQAEALAWMGELQLTQGNAIAARNALERALVLAPDYARARELLARATSGR
jgi:hypothetical protein